MDSGAAHGGAPNYSHMLAGHHPQQSETHPHQHMMELLGLLRAVSTCFYAEHLWAHPSICKISQHILRAYRAGSILGACRWSCWLHLSTRLMRIQACG